VDSKRENTVNRNSEATLSAAAMAAPAVQNSDGIRRRERGQRRFCHSIQEQSEREMRIRLEERHNERARIARELHDTLFQGFYGASMQLHNAVEKMPAHSPERHSLADALRLVRRVLDEGRTVLQGLRAPGFVPASIEQELSGFLEEFSPSGVRCEISVSGRPRELKPAVQEQINLIGREALVNALLHSTATRIEAEVEYSPRRVRVLVRDNGCGIDPCVAQTRGESHWGLLGMRERAESIGARLTIWSRPGAGTEVEVSVGNQALAEACA
jgi:signal transduction histidine kinase